MALDKGEDGIPVISSDDLAASSLAGLDAIRRETGVVRPHPQRVVVLRAADVAPLLGDHRLLQLPGAQYAAVWEIPHGRTRTFLETFMLMSNGEDHAHRRGAFIRTFAHPVIRRKRGEVRAVADRIVADLPRGEPFDFLGLCASRLPAEMIAEVLGLAVEDSPWFAGRVYSFSRCLAVPYDHAAHDEIEAAAEALYGFVARTLADRRTAPRDDLISMLVGDESARALDGDDLIYQVMGLILGGSDTTRSGFNMLVARLLGERALWDEVQANRDLIPAAIDEALRLEPPVGGVPRFVPAPIEIAGHMVAANQVLGLATLSAMRDDAAVADPERFDLHRTDRPTPHLVFGGGPHRCLGEMLARIELEEGLAALMDGAPGIEMIEAPRMLGLSGIRHATPMIARID